MKRSILLLFLCILSLVGFSQTVTYDTTFLGWPAIVTRHVNHWANDSVQGVIFFPGAGEIGNDVNKLRLHGPHKVMLETGWDGSVTLGNGTHYPVIISLQPPNSSASSPLVKDRLNAILSRFKIRRNSLHFTGISRGGNFSTKFVAYMANATDYSYADMVNSMWLVQGEDAKFANVGSQPIGWPMRYGWWSKNFGGRIVYMGQINDAYRQEDAYCKAMNDSVPGSAANFTTSFGGGTHEKFEETYYPNRTWTLSTPDVDNIDWSNTAGTQTTPLTSTNCSWIQWLLRNGDTTLPGTNAKPVVNIANVSPITLPTDSVLLSGSATDADGTITSLLWTKVSGPAGDSIYTPDSAHTTISGLVAGTYVYKLTATDNDGDTASGTVNVVVNPMAGPSQTVTYDTTFLGWPAIVTRHVNHWANDSVQGVIFFPGAGEIGNDVNKLRLHGPHKIMLETGWDGSVELGNGTHYPVIISLQPPNASAASPLVKDRLNAILSTFKIRRNSLHFTGVSLGGNYATKFVVYMANANDYSYADMINSMWLVQGQDAKFAGVGSQPIGWPMRYGWWSKNFGGRIVYMGQIIDTYRQEDAYCKAMNDSMPGSATNFTTSFGGGGHEAFEETYYPDRTWTLSTPDVENIDWSNTAGIQTTPLTSTNCSWIQWLLRNGDTTLTGANLKPVVTIANVSPITLPTDSVQLQGSATDPDGTIVSYLWEQIEGPSTGTLADSSNPVTTFSNLVEGLYVLKLTATDNDGDTAALMVNVWVSPMTDPSQTVTYDTSFLGWPAIVTRHINHWANDSVQGVIFFPGAGEIGNDVNELRLHGPHKIMLETGWDGSVELGNGTHYPVIISLQPPNASASSPLVKDRLDAILSAFKIRRNSLHFTGVSTGGNFATKFVVYMANVNDNSYADMVNSMWLVQGQDAKFANVGSQPIGWPMRYGWWSKNFGGRLVYMGQIADTYRQEDAYCKAMNDSMPGSAANFTTSFGGGGHEAYEETYYPDRTWTLSTPDVENIDWSNTAGSQTTPLTSTNCSWIQWLLRNGDTTLTGFNARHVGVATAGSVSGDKRPVIVQLMPNPVREVLLVKVQTKDISITIVDGLGRVIRKTTMQSGVHYINLHGVPAGHYQVIIHQRGKWLETQGILKL